MASYDYNNEIVPLISPIGSYCDGLRQRDSRLATRTGEEIMNAVFKDITGLPDLPALIDYLRRVKVAETNSIVQKLRAWRPDACKITDAVDRIVSS